MCIATLVKSVSRLIAKKNLESHNKFDNAPNLHYATLIENMILDVKDLSGTKTLNNSSYNSKQTQAFIYYQKWYKQQRKS